MSILNSADIKVSNICDRFNFYSILLFHAIYDLDCSQLKIHKIIVCDEYFVLIIAFFFTPDRKSDSFPRD